MGAPTQHTWDPHPHTPHTHLDSNSSKADAKMIGNAAENIGLSVAVLAVITPIVRTWLAMGPIRTKALKDEGLPEWTHPYKPHENKCELIYRCYRAQENIKEWSNIAMPLTVIFSVFLREMPVVGVYHQPIVAEIGIAYHMASMAYFDGYKQSVKGREGPFRRRSMVIRVLLFGSIGLVGYTAFDKYVMGLLL